MTTSDAVSTGALLLMGVITLVLMIQYLKLRDVWQMLRECKAACRSFRY